MFRNQSVSSHQFAMVPRADIPRAAFNMDRGYKTTFDAGYLIPVFCEEVLPGDSMSTRMTAFARMATPIFPLMDNAYLDSFFFFVPNRLVWSNWKKFMGEQNAPGDSISFVVPKISSGANGYLPGTLFDYFGLPTSGQIVIGNSVTHQALPLRAYNLIYNEWFRDENLCAPAVVNLGDGPDNTADYVLRRRGKRHDYFTSALPWPQKGGAAVTIPLGTSAPIRSDGNQIQIKPASSLTSVGMTLAAAAGSPLISGAALAGGGAATWNGAGGIVSGMYADLSVASAATINQLRTSFQVQRLLERDARGGTRYTEILRAHFGVVSPDGRLQRPEYLGGGSTPLNLSPVAQTSGTGAAGQSTPLGTLSAIGTLVAHNHGFSQSFTEHGYVIGLVSVRADLTYQQGLRRHWSRSTRYDFYFPAFAMLGEQAVLGKEIYCLGDGSDDGVFGYQERWAEYRYSPSQITGLFRSTSAGTLDAWHLSQRFATRPALNQAFIEENPPFSRVLAVGAAANGAQFIFDSVFKTRAVRPMPLYSVPGMIDHF